MAFGEGDPYNSSAEYLKNPENKSKIMESVLCDHLIQFLFDLNLSPQFDYTKHVLYWRSKKGREVDFIVKLGNTFLPIELKYQSAIRRDDLFGIIDFMKGGNSSKKGIIMTKEGFSEEEDYVKLPVSLLLFIM